MTDDQEKMLNDLLAKESGLSGWEVDFLDNLNNNWRDRDLSEKQADVLEKIAFEKL